MSNHDYYTFIWPNRVIMNILRMRNISYNTRMATQKSKCKCNKLKNYSPSTTRTYTALFNSQRVKMYDFHHTEMGIAEENHDTIAMQLKPINFHVV